MVVLIVNDNNTRKVKKSAAKTLRLYMRERLVFKFRKPNTGATERRVESLLF